MTHNASAIAAELRPILQRRIDSARRSLADAHALLGQSPVRKSSSRPFLVHIQHAESHFRDQLIEALRFGLDPKQIARQWHAKPKPVAKDDTDDAEVFDEDAESFAENLPVDSTALAASLTAILGVGYLIGAKEGLTALRSVLADPSLSEVGLKADALDWSQWKPGDAAAAAELAGMDGGAGLQALLDSADVTIKSIQVTRLEQLAGALAEGARSGESVDELRKRISDLLDDPSRADLIATTELNRAVTASTLAVYGQNGIAQWDLLTFNPCEICADVEAGNPHDMGDDPPPYHPGDRCACGPHLPEEA